MDTTNVWVAAIAGTIALLTSLFRRTTRLDRLKAELELLKAIPEEQSGRDEFSETFSMSLKRYKVANENMFSRRQDFATLVTFVVMLGLSFGLMSAAVSSDHMPRWWSLVLTIVAVCGVVLTSRVVGATIRRLMED